MQSTSEEYGNLSWSVWHCVLPRSVRRGSRMVWLAVDRLWKPWAWRTKVIVGVVMVLSFDLRSDVRRRKEGLLSAGMKEWKARFWSCLGGNDIVSRSG